MRSALVLALLSAGGATAAYDDDDTLFNLLITEKEAYSLEIATEIESLFTAYQSAGGTSCYGYSACASTLSSVTCDSDFGVTNGCDCDGRAIDKMHTTVFAMDNVVASADAKNAVCYTDGIDSYFTNIAWNTESEYKWMYYGTQEGVLINFPGLLSERADCKAGTYDPRTRPWYVMGASGPKDVILIIDKSGSMGSYDRMGYARDAAVGVVNSLTNIDYVSVVTFSSAADSENSMLVQAEEGYRSRMISDIEAISEGGYTYYVKAMTKAFAITAKSDENSYGSGCNRIYVMLTDGDPSDDLDVFQTLLGANLRDKDMFFFIILGSGVDSDVQAEIQTIICAVGGIFIKTPDNDPDALDEAMASYYQYLAVGAMLNEVQPTRWSEPYTSIPDIWGEVVSAVTPVFDKSGTIWTMIGVSAVDLPLCELVAEAAGNSVGWVDDTIDDYRSMTTASGCECEDTWSYQGKSYTSCTTDDWSKPWCATPAECGFELNSVSTGWWDDCNTDSNTVEGKVKTFLQEKSAVCYSVANMSYEALEVLRGTYTCSGNIDDDEWSSILTTANIFTGTQDWEKSGFAVDNDATLTDTTYDTAMTDCTTCVSGMRPSCSLDDCNEGLIAANEIAVSAAPRRAAATATTAAAGALAAAALSATAALAL